MLAERLQLETVRRAWWAVKILIHDPLETRGASERRATPPYRPSATRER
jgi:hypothetical protein